MEAVKTTIKGDAKGGLLDKLVNGGEFPPIQIEINKNTLLQLGITIVVSVSLCILIGHILKQVFLKKMQ